MNVNKRNSQTAFNSSARVTSKGLGVSRRLNTEKAKLKSDKAEKVEEKISKLKNDIDILDEEATERLKTVMSLLQGTSNDSNLALDLRLNKLANKAEVSKEQSEKEMSDLKIRKMEVNSQVKTLSQKFDRLKSEQNFYKNQVSSKSNESVDIKPGKTIEDVYVSLRTRGKILKGQGSPDAPVLQKEDKVHLLPERSIRVIKEFLVDLKDHDSPELEQLKEENKALKSQGQDLYTHIKETHVRDKVHGAPEENTAKQFLENYEKMYADTVSDFEKVEGVLKQQSDNRAEMFEMKSELGREHYERASQLMELFSHMTRLSLE